MSEFLLVTWAGGGNVDRPPIDRRRHRRLHAADRAVRGGSLDAPEQLRAAITEVLDEPRYALAASAMAATIDCYGRGAVAVEELERLAEV
jgi:hypothetical protein